MNKKAKIFTIFIVILLAGFFCLLFFIKHSEKNVDLNFSINHKAAKKVDLAKLESDYRQSVKQIFNEFVALIQEKNIDIAKVKEEKNKLLNLRVTEQFKDLHINFVLAVVKMEKYLSGGDEADKNASEEIVKKIKNNYSWLN